MNKLISHANGNLLNKINRNCKSTKHKNGMMLIKMTSRKDT